jgi:hypothetical protein
MGDGSAARSSQGVRDSQTSREPAAASQHMLGQLFGEVSRELGALVQQEVELAKAQLREESEVPGPVDLRSHLMVLAAGLSVLFGALAAAWGLAAVLPTGVAFLLVAVAFGIVAGVLLRQVRRGDGTGDAGTGARVRARAGGDNDGDGDGDGDGEEAPADRRIQLVDGRTELR